MGFGPLIIDYICNFFYLNPPNSSLSNFKVSNHSQVCLFHSQGVQMKEKYIKICYEIHKNFMLIRKHTCMK